MDIEISLNNPDAQLRAEIVSLTAAAKDAKALASADISRFQPQVQTLRLKKAVIDDDLVSQVYFGMSEVSSYTGHDRPTGKGGALAEPTECEKHLAAFTACLDEADTKSKAAIKSRDGKIKPMKA